MNQKSSARRARTLFLYDMDKLKSADHKVPMK